MLADLPNEILLRVAEFLLIPDIHAAALTASRFFHAFDHCLYRRSAETSYALWWAARYDRPQTARKAVEAGATVGCPASPTQNGRSAHDLSRPARAFSLGRWCTPLMLAAAYNHHRVVECLLELDPAGINHRGKRGVTALHEAVRRRVVVTAELLLNLRGIDANVLTDDGTTPLLCAVKGRHAGMIKLLLESGKVEPDLALGRERRSPLSYAAEYGPDDIVRLLLETGRVDPDSRDRTGKTPLMWTAKGGRVDCARLLLATGQVNPESRDNYESLPLTLAAGSGRFGIVKLLLGSDKVDPDSRDGAGRTPLISAAKRGRFAIVKLLLDSGRVDPDAKDDDETTPLLWAVEGRWSEIAKLLLETGRVDPDSRDPLLQTPLILAVRNKMFDIVKLLLETDRVNPDSRDHLGRSPLMLAVRHRLPDMVKLFLETGRCSSDLEDHSGKTPLFRAAEQGLTDIARLLLQTGGADPNSGAGGAWTPLNRAITTNASGKRDGVIRLLVAHQGTDLEARSAGLTPLIHAARRGDGQLMRQLLDSGRANPNTVSAAGKTALHTAVGGGHEEPVRVLLGHSDVDVNRRDGEGFTPLGRAARVGCTAIAELLLRSGKVSDINARCGDAGGTPLWWAAVEGRGRAARALCLHGRGEAELRSDIDGDGPELTDGMVENIIKVVKKPYRRGLVKTDAWYRTILEDGLFEGMCAGDEGLLARRFSSEEEDDGE